MADITIATTLAAHVSVGTPAILIATVSLSITIGVTARRRIRARRLLPGGRGPERGRPQKPGRGSPAPAMEDFEVGGHIAGPVLGAVL